MKPTPLDLSTWPTDAASAIALQHQLADKVRTSDDFPPIKVIAGIDVSYDLRNNISRAVIVTMLRSELKPMQVIIAQAPMTFPYVPGLLSFREIPAIAGAYAQLKEVPDLLMVDGQGIAHPRRLGIAAHLGVLTGLPAIGVAKSRLTGRYHEPGPDKGDQTALMHGNTRIGTVLRSKDNANPLFISPGHRIGHETAVKLTVQCLTRYRLPEPTRIADKISKDKSLPPTLI